MYFRTMSRMGLNPIVLTQYCYFYPQRHGNKVKKPGNVNEFP